VVKSGTGYDRANAAGGVMTDPEDDGVALFVAMPERHLRSAAALDRDVVHLPLGRVGDLPSAPTGSSVYVVTLDDDGVAARAATWRAVLLGWASPEPDDPPIDGLPPSWVEERAAHDAPDATTEETGASDGAEEEPLDEDEDDDDDDPGRQVFLEVRGLTELERRDWIFANEVVPKQRRGSRTFVPMSPTLVRVPD
jgi:hypothetical protein